MGTMDNNPNVRRTASRAARLRARWRGACAALFAAALPAVPMAQPALDASQRILSGLEPFTRTMSWPATIEFPAAWREAFLAMTALQRTTGKEQGACLSVSPSARDAAEIDKLLQAYLALRAQRGQMAAAEFDRKEQALRARIEAPADGPGARGLRWQVGAPQQGTEMSVSMEENITTCGGSYLGRVHTHPPGAPAAFSDTDLTNAVLEPGLKLSVVLTVDNDACIAVRGVGTREAFTASPLHFGNGTRSAMQNRWEFKVGLDVQSMALIYRQAHANARNNVRTTTDMAVTVQRGLTATAMGEVGGALYCGAIGQPLKRVEPMAPAGLVDNKAADQPGLVIATKALVIMLNRLDSPGWRQAPRFPFTPVLDGEFLAYLRSLQASGADEKEVVAAIRELASGPVADLSLPRLFRLVLALSGENFPALAPDGLYMPDDRSGPRAERQAMFRCLSAAADQGDIACQVFDVSAGRATGIAAQYRYTPVTGEGTAVHLFADQATGVVLTFGAEPTTYHGQLQSPEPGKSSPKPHGQGVVETPTHVYKGAFERGMPQGRGSVTDKATGVTREVIIEKGKSRALP